MLTFLLMGKTGNGKSSLGNTLLKRNEYFETSGSTASVTSCVKSGYGYFDTYSIKVVDGPGLCDTESLEEESIENTINNMTTALAMCGDGVDAFLLVLRYPNRYTKEEQNVVTSLKNIFGENYFQHLIVVVTGGDNFEKGNRRNMNFVDWCRNQTGAFQILFTDCEERVVLINNYETDEQKNQKQIDVLVSFAEKLQFERGRYTSAFFQKAKSARDKFIVERKAPQLEEEILEKIGQLTSYINNKRMIDKEDADRMIKILKAEIEFRDKETNVLGSLKNLVETMHENVNDAYKLRQLSADLDNALESKIKWAEFASDAGILFGAALCAPFLLIGGAIGAAGGGIATLKAKIKENKIRKEQNRIEEKRKAQK